MVSATDRAIGKWGIIPGRYRGVLLALAPAWLWCPHSLTQKVKCPHMSAMKVGQYVGAVD